MSAGEAEFARKAVHIAMGGFALLLRYLTPLQAAGMALGALLFSLFALHPLTGGRLLRARERKRSLASGIVLYPLSVFALIVVFHRSLHLAAAAWGLLAFGDGMAGLLGRALGGRKLPWNREKSWAGLAAFVVFGSVAAVFLGTWVRPADRPAAGVFVVGCIAAALVAGVVESLRSGIDDNVLVPLAGGATLYVASVVQPQLLAASASDLGRNALVGFGVSLVFAAAAWRLGGVRRSGAIGGILVGTALYTLTGAPGFSVLVAFFVLGTTATRIGYARKAVLGIAQSQGGRRGAREALANSFAALVFGFMSVATPEQALFRVAVVAALATAAADTVSSEIGQAFGRRHYLSTTFRPVPAGTDGAVSFEGTLSGVAASTIVASVALGAGIVSPGGALIVMVAAFAGTTFESILGATLERPLGLGNDVVNFANTVAGGLAAIALATLLRIG